VGEEQVNYHPNHLVGQEPQKKAENENCPFVHTQEEYAACVDKQKSRRKSTQ
jgi:hypothetical protein